MTPGNIATLVAETGGVRVQVTSPALGASNVRMQGNRSVDTYWRPVEKVSDPVRYYNQS